MSRSRAVYRLLHRAINNSFKGDRVMVDAARKEVRNHFEESRGVRDPAEVDKLVAQGEEAASFMKEFVVQAKLNERGNYAMQVNSSQADIVIDAHPQAPLEPR